MAKSAPLELQPQASTSSNNTINTIKHHRRAHVPASVLKALKLAAGDFVVLRPTLTAEALAGVKINGGHQYESTYESGQNNSSSKRWILAVAWPSFSQDSACQLSQTLVKEIAGLAYGDYVTVEPMVASGLSGAPVLSLSVKCLDANSLNTENKASERLLLSYIKQALGDLKCISQQQTFSLYYHGSSRSFSIDQIDFDHDRPDADIGLIAPTTEVTVSASKIATEEPETKSPHTLTPDAAGSGYAQVGGLASQIQLIRELVEVPLTRPELYTHFAMTPPRGLLLYGPPGTGKTLLAHTIASSLGVKAFSVAGASLSSPYHGETEAGLRAIFDQAKAASPAIIVLDEVDALAPKREDAGEVEKRVVAELLTLMDGLDSKPSSSPKNKKEGEVKKPGPQIMVIACTNRPNAIDAALRRPGRFDKEIEIGIPNVEARLHILQVLLRQTPHDLDPATLFSFANRSHGFVGADLASLVHSSCLNAIRRSVAAAATAAPSSADMRMNAADMEAAFLTTRPSAMREVFLEVPKVKWEDIGGQASIKQRLKESVEWPLTRKATFERLGFKPPAGVLLYGPPGCSKTLIAKAVATEAGLNFMAVKGPEIFNKFVGESERTIRALFQKARSAAPSVLFLDEIDAIATSRASDETSTGDRVLTTLLTEMDGMEPLQGVIILAATNRPWSLDSALMRPGRLDRLLYVEPPDLEGRKAILRINLTKMRVDPALDLDLLAQMSEGCSGAEMVSICQSAALSAMNQEDDPAFIKQEHFKYAATSIRRGITADMLRTFEDWRDQRH